MSTAQTNAPPPNPSVKTTTNLITSRTHHPPTVATASDTSELRAALSHLQSRHAALTASLDNALATQPDLNNQLARLDLTRARLSTLSNSTRSLSSHLHPASTTATKLSDAVSRLDTEQSRVKATLDVVSQVAELKQCILGVVGSMGAPQDWENAAEYMSRARRIPQEVVESAFAEQNVPTAEVPDAPAATLDSASESLCRLFMREFDAAVERGDGSGLTRFFKMFPLIGRAKEGLDAYARYVCQGVALRARQRMQSVRGSQQDGAVYVQALTKLIEHIAQVIDGHSSLVQRHYGTGTMLRVMERLHGEADVQGGIVLDTWWDERNVERKITEVKSYAYTFLVQSFLPVPGRGMGSSTPRSRSPAPGRRRADTPEVEEEGIDIKEIDQLLAEITSMLGPWSLYLRFCASRAAESELDGSEATELPPLTVPNFITSSNLPKKIERNLTEPFKTFATFILRRSVERAFQLEEKPSGLSLNINKSLPANTPYITSAVDDVMYMVRQVLSRALATSQAGLVIATAASVGRVLGSDFIGMIQRKMRDESYPKAAIQGSMPPEDKVLTFLVLMNNLDVATSYIRRIVHEHLPEESPSQTNGHTSAPRPLTDLFPLGKDAVAVRNALTTVEGAFCSKANDLIDDGMQVLYTHVLRPRMQPLLVEMLSTTSYAADEDSDSSQTSNSQDSETSTAKSIAQRGWTARTKPLRRLLTEANARRLTLLAVDKFSNMLENRIWGYQGRVTEMGAVKLERDIADIANAVVSGEDFRLREEFNRCLEIVSVMNMDEEEWAEVEALEAEGTTAESMWALSSKERHRARSVVLGRG